MKTILLSAVALAVSCATTRSEDLTAVEHRNEAQLHEQRAAQERGQYDSGATRSVPVRSPFGEGEERITGAYNPTAEHLYAADREMRAAADHLKAARRIEAFEDARCLDIAPEARGACPLLASQVKRVAESERGVVLYLKEGVDAVDTHKRLDCHLAYAQSQGFSRPSCPLFVKGMQLSLELTPEHAIRMYSDDPAVSEEIKAQARRIFLGQLSMSER